jgi:NitT/TauT family transport system substrate-binding protein
MSKFRSVCASVACLCVLWGSSANASQPIRKIEPVTIAQFGHVFLYLPVYVALDKGFFRQQGLDVKLISTGGDEKTFTAVASGNAQFGVSDPTFVAIARQQGRGGKVVGGIVSGMPFWMVSFDPKLAKINNPAGLAGYRIATYTAPSTSYAVVKELLQNGGKPVQAKIVQGAYGTLLPMLKAKQADVALEIEPVVSIATHQGARVVYSPGTKLGTFTVTGLMVTDDFRTNHGAQVQSAVNAIKSAMDYIHRDFDGAVAVAKKEFPEMDDSVIRDALKRMIQEGTIPASPLIKTDEWARAVSLRKSIGDLKGSGSFEENVDMSFVNAAK